MKKSLKDFMSSRLTIGRKKRNDNSNYGDLCGCAETGSGAFNLLFSIMAASAAFFCASRASRVLSATLLPAITRLGFFAGLVVGVGVATCSVGELTSDPEVLPWEGCSVNIVQRYTKQIFFLCNCSIERSNYSTVGEGCSGTSSVDRG